MKLADALPHLSAPTAATPAVLRISNTPLSGGDVAQLAEHVERQPPLAKAPTALAVRNAGLDDAAALRLAHALQRNETLTAVALGHNPIGVEGVSALAAMLLGNATLIELKLNECRFADAGLEALATALVQTQTLERLSLRRNELTGRGGAALAPALAVSRSLFELDLGENALGDDGAVTLADGLSRNRCLRVLDLSRCGITDVGAAALAQLLLEQDNLRTLDLEGNVAISDEGGLALSTALKRNGGLVTLVLDDTQVSPTVLANIDKHLAVNRERLKALRELAATAAAGSPGKGKRGKGARPHASPAQAAKLKANKAAALQSKRVTLYLNGTIPDGKGPACTVPRSLDKLREVARDKFDLTLPVRKFFQAGGKAVETVDQIEDGSVVFVSLGEPFRRAAAKPDARQQQREQLRQQEEQRRMRQEGGPMTAVEVKAPVKVAVYRIGRPIDGTGAMVVVPKTAALLRAAVAQAFGLPEDGSTVRLFRRDGSPVEKVAPLEHKAALVLAVGDQEFQAPPLQKDLERERRKEHAAQLQKSRKAAWVPGCAANSEVRPVRVRVFKNGDKVTDTGGVSIRVPKTWDMFLDECTRWASSGSFSIRKVFTAEGKPITKLDKLADGMAVVASRGDAFKPHGGAPAAAGAGEDGAAPQQPLFRAAGGSARSAIKIWVVRNGCFKHGDESKLGDGTDGYVSVTVPKTFPLLLNAVTAKLQYDFAVKNLFTPKGVPVEDLGTLAALAAEHQRDSPGSQLLLVATTGKPLQRRPASASAGPGKAPAVARNSGTSSIKVWVVRNGCPAPDAESKLGDGTDGYLPVMVGKTYEILLTAITAKLQYDFSVKTLYTREGTLVPDLATVLNLAAEQRKTDPSKLLLLVATTGKPFLRPKGQISAKAQKQLEGLSKEERAMAAMQMHAKKGKAPACAAASDLRPPKVFVYGNGEEVPQQFRERPRQIIVPKTWELLLTACTGKLDLPNAARRIFHYPSGKELLALKDLEDDSVVVATNGDPFRRYKKKPKPAAKKKAAAVAATAAAAAADDHEWAR